MNCSINYEQCAIINVLSVVYEPTEELRRTAAQAAIFRAAARGLFSLKDVWAELGLFVKSDRIREFRERYYSAYFIRGVLHDLGVKSVLIDCERASGRRYYIPAASVSGGELIVC